MPAKAQSLDTIFCAAIEIASPEHRADYLADACGEDADLHCRVAKLVDAHFRAGSFLEGPMLGSGETEKHRSGETATCPDDEVARPGTVIGPYKLLKAIGEGGMGTVYMAEQTEPVRREVALKLIKPGMDSRQVIARFEAERQALALMDHPNIARVLDAGTTQTGRPFFVMELVRGIPITEFCDKARLSIPERLELFVSVCRAVQHAHQKGVIHRDLKPTNVLVTELDGTPVPKVIDFGVAKAVGQRLTEKTLYTGFLQLVGTPLYMSPEQAELSGLDVDTRSDVYSLGVLLYELLTGTTPFDPQTFRIAALDEIRRIIREQDPPPPSSRLTTQEDSSVEVSARRGSEPRRLAMALRGELDWIVMKALEKNRERRYETANGLAADVLRHLNAQPVVACPPSPLYQFQTFARRNRGMLTSACLIFLALVTGTAVSVWQSIKATRAAKEANLRAEESRQVIDYLTRDLFMNIAQGNRSMTLGEFYDQTELALETQFEDKPLVEAAIRLALGEVDALLNRRDRLPYQAARAAELRERHLGPLHPATLEARHLEAQHLCSKGWRLPWNRYNPEANEVADRLLREVLAARRQVLGPTHPDTLYTQAWLAMNLSQLGLYEKAEALAAETERLALETVGPGHRSTLQARFVRALAAFWRGHYQRAELLARQLAEGSERALGPLDWYTLMDYRLLSNIVDRTGQTDKAIALYKGLIDRFSRALGPTHVAFDGEFGVLLALQLSKGDHAAIRDYWEPWLRSLLTTPVPTDAYSRERRAKRLNFFTHALLLLSDDVPFDTTLVESALEQLIDLKPEPWDSDLWVTRIGVDVATGRVEEARALVRSLREDIDEAPRAWNNTVWSAVKFNASASRSAILASIMERVLEVEPENGAYWDTLGVARYRAGDWQGAIAALERSQVLSQEKSYPEYGFFLALAYAQAGNTQAAEAWYTKSGDWLRQHPDNPGWEVQIRRAEAARVLGLTTPP